VELTLRVAGFVLPNASSSAWLAPFGVRIHRSPRREAGIRSRVTEAPIRDVTAALAGAGSEIRRTRTARANGAEVGENVRTIGGKAKRVGEKGAADGGNAPQGRGIGHAGWGLAHARGGKSVCDRGNSSAVGGKSPRAGGNFQTDRNGDPGGLTTESTRSSGYGLAGRHAIYPIRGAAEAGRQAPSPPWMPRARRVYGWLLVAS
jgi:hypothetical protein